MAQLLNKRNLHRVVEYFLDKGGDKVAIEQSNRVCTYAELDARSNDVCAKLRQLKLGRGDVVALPMSASIDYVVALLAVVKHGGIFMPLDPNFPEARLRRMLELAKPRVVIGSGDNPNAVERIAALANVDIATLLLSPDWPSPAERMPVVAGDDDTGYLIHTSGSTGEPKMIAGRNKGISHFVHWEIAEFGIDDNVRASFFAPPTFDVSLREIFVPLLAGGTLVIPDTDVRSDARRLTGWIREQRITLVHCVPSLFRLITRTLTDEPQPLPSLRMVALAGEPLYGADVSAWRSVAGRATQLVNLYGPSETSLAKAFYRIDDEPAANAIVPLGQPIANTALLILRDGRLCEIGETGEIHIATPFASNGYYENPDLTAQAFIANPLTPETADRIYRTGDLGRYRHDRSVEFMGRADRQVKVNGVRIELPEIEGAMRGCTGITDAAAHTFRLGNGENILVGYYTAGATLDAQTLRAELQKTLPDNMLPGYLMQLDEFPRNLNGKVDRKALPRPESLIDRDHNYTPPQGEIEEELAKLWAEALGLDRVGATSPYLQIGGNSLRAIGLIGRIGQRFGVSVSIRDFFESGTVRALAARIANSQTPQKQAIPFAPEQADYPLTDAQAGLWILDKVDHAKRLYNNVEWLELHGPLDINALRTAFQTLIERHESLRTAYIEVDGEPRQRILQTVPLAWSEEFTDNADKRINDVLHEERLRHFDLSSGQLMHVRLLTQTTTLHHLVINMHHIACDGWSMATLVRELCASYEAAKSGNAPIDGDGQSPRYRIRDLACWLKDTSSAQQARGERWRSKLADADRRAAIPANRILDANADLFIAGKTALEIPVEHAALLRERLAAQGATPFMAVAAAFSVLLYRYGGSETVVIGTPLAGRSQSEWSSVVGFMVNTLPLVLRLSPEVTFATLMDRSKHAIQDLSDSEFDTPAKWLNGNRAAADPARNPFFDAVLAMEPAPGFMILNDLRVIEHEVPDAPARYDLSLRLQDNGETLRLILEYRQALYDDAAMNSMLTQLGRLLTMGVTEPTLPLSRLPMLTAQESEALLRLAQGPSQPLPETSVHHALSLLTDAIPNTVAIKTIDSEHTYRWLDHRANRIANVLCNDMNVKPGDVVAVLLDREPDWPAAILGILKVGAIYLPLDSWHPSQRHRLVMEDAGARVLISRIPLEAESIDVSSQPTSDLVATATSCNATLLNLATLDDSVAPQSPIRTVQPDDPAYLIYTSGSTGTPKGVLVSHRAFLNMIVDQIDALDMGRGDTVLQFVSPAFDVSLFEIFLPLLSGGRLALVDRHLCNTATGFASTVESLGVTVAAMTPGFLNSLGDLPLSGLRMIISGGEAPIAADVQHRLQQGIRYINAYGPTEVAVCAAFYELHANAPLTQPIPIGRPTANLTLHVVAPDLTPLPVNAIGELAIAGAGLALAYYRQTALTEQAFVTNTLAAGNERLYRTGDRVRRLSDGNLVFVGRNDEQVKIRGHRIEIGEVEAVLRKQPGIRDARIVARSIGQDMELAAYWTGEEKDVHAVRDALVRQLPDYMVPRLLMWLDTLPLNANGKLDRERLPQQLPMAENYQAPHNADEALLATLWSELLDRQQVSRYDNFFDLGGNSLSANRLALRAAKALGIEVTLADIYSAHTPAELADRIRNRSSLPQYTLPVLSADQPAPLSPMQRRLWVIDQLGESGSTYHIGGITRLSGSLNVEALRKAFDDVVARHDVLRTRFVAIDNEPKQIVDAAGPTPWTTLPAGLSLSALRTQLEAIAHQPFKLSQEWPVRVVLAEESASNEVRQWQLLVVLHHIAADGWSMPILEAELTQAYRARLQGAAPAWTPLPVQYRDIATWLEQRIQEEAFADDRSYWLTQLQAPLPLLDLPSDRPRPAVRRFHGATLDYRLSDSTVEAVRRCAQTHSVTLFTVLLTGLQTLFYRLSGQDDLIIGVPVAGRQHPASENLIGFFVNTLPLRERIDGKQGFAARLQTAAQTMQQALLHQAYPFDRLVSDLDIGHDTSRSALFDVMIGLDEASALPQLPNVNVEALPLTRQGSRCDMSWMFEFGTASPALHVEFDTDLFDEERIVDWARRFEHLLSAAIAKPDMALDRLDLLFDDERTRLLQAAVAPATCSVETTVIRLFESQAAAHESAPALITASETWTYGQLNRAANRLARKLQRIGIRKSDTPIALLATRGAAMVVAQLAIQKYGAAYLPIEPDAPAERTALLLADSGAQILLHEPALELTSLPSGLTRVPLIIPGESEEENHNLHNTLTPDDSIYVMYTSGSTGRPKGVVALHRGVVRLVQQPGYYTPETGDRLLQLSNYAFDGATFDFYAALTNGLTLCIPDQETVLDPRALANFVEHHGVNVSFITTALFNRLVDEAPDVLPHFRRLYFGGQEASLPHVCRAFECMTKNTLVHVYGPTECTTFATWHTIRSQDIDSQAIRLPIGKPIAHTSTYLLDAHQALLPAGIPGELYIGGAGLAKEYLGQTEMTSERFVASDFNGGERLYRTGDLCVLRQDGAIEFLGRLDGQVKVRGFRIELGEIEHHLLTHSAIEKVHVMPRRNDSGNTELVAYLTARDVKNPPTLSALLAHLERALPRYMLPAHFVLLDAMPVNRNGKVDRNALPPAETNALQEKPQASIPVSSVSIDEAAANRQAVLLNAWQTILKRDTIGLRDNYFTIGGDSIQAIQIVSHLRKQGFALKVTDLLRYPTIEQLVPLIGSSEKQQKRSLPGNADIPMTPIQHWFMESPFVKQHFNQSILVRLPSNSDVNRLTKALAALEAHHDALRLRFGVDQDGKPRQRIAPVESVQPIHEYTLTGDDTAQSMHAEINKLQRSFVPDAAPLWRAALFHLPSDGDRLFLTVHHWAVDGISWRILLDDLANAYQQTATLDAVITLPTTGASFSEWGLALQEAAKEPRFTAQRDYWRHQASADTGLLPRLADVPPAPLSERLVLKLSLSSEKTAALFGACHDAYRTRSDELLIAAWVHALTAIQDHNACRLILESHGREALSESIDVGRTVGWFTAAYPVVLKAQRDDWSNHIREVKEALRAVPDHGIGYGLLRYMNRDAQLNNAASGEVVFNYLGRFDHTGEPLPIADESTGDELDPAIRLPHSLDINAELRDGELHIKLVGDCARHPASCFHELRTALEASLNAAIDHCLSPEAGGLSPSDVDLQGIDISELDNILNSIESL